MLAQPRKSFLNTIKEKINRAISRLFNMFAFALVATQFYLLYVGFTVDSKEASRCTEDPVCHDAMRNSIAHVFLGSMGVQPFVEWGVRKCFMPSYDLCEQSFGHVYPSDVSPFKKLKKIR